MTSSEHRLGWFCRPGFHDRCGKIHTSLWSGRYTVHPTVLPLFSVSSCHSRGGWHDSVPILYMTPNVPGDSDNLCPLGPRVRHCDTFRTLVSICQGREVSFLVVPSSSATVSIKKKTVTISSGGIRVGSCGWINVANNLLTYALLSSHCLRSWITLCTPTIEMRLHNSERLIFVEYTCFLV